MKKIYLLLMFVALAGMGFGQITTSYDFSASGAVSGLNEAAPGIALDGNIGFGSFKNSGTSDPVINGGQLRLYQNATKGGSIKIYASNGVTITEVVVHASGTTGPAAYTVDGGAATDLTAGTTYTMSGLSATSVVEFYQKDGSSSNRIYVDDFDVTYTTSSSVDDPTNFSSATASTTEIDLSWTQNANSDNVMVAWSSDGTFGTPSDGTTYSAGNSITGGGTVLYNGSATTYNHTGLTPGTQYFYKAWAVDGSTNYSTGVITNATTYKNEPSNHVTSFSATANGTVVNLSWSENDGAVIPDGYIIMANTGTITDPVDGTDPADDTDLTDGSGNVEVAHGTTSYSFTNCSSLTTYNFKIYPYTNSSSAIDFKTSTPVPDASATTGTPDKLIISEVADPSDHYLGRFVELYNAGSSDIDLAAGNWNLTIQSNGANYTDKALSGVIHAGETFVASYSSSNFNTYYGFDSDQNSGFGGNGDDGYYLYKGGDHSSGTLVDAYGVIDEDGTGKAWEYTDSHAVRNSSVTESNTTWTSSEWTITSAAVADMTPGTHGDCITFNGSSTSAWGTAGNWVGGTAPTSSNNVKVPAGLTNNPSVDGDATTPSECNSLTITSGATLTIPVNKALTVNGTLTNNAGNSGLVVQSDATGNGSLIFASGTPDATVQRYIAGYSDADHGWHTICSPVDMTVAGSGWEPGTTSPNNDDLYYWHEETNQWMNYKAGAFTFNQGQGYLVAYETGAAKEFTGSLRSTSITFDTLSRDNATGKGWNLLGNPFSSAIEWNNNGDWVFTNVSNVPNVWDESGATYANPNVGDPIPSTNGFFVQVADGSDGQISITIPASARFHNSHNNYKSTASNSEANTLKMTVTTDANTFYNKIRVGFKADATQEWDVKYDAHKMYGAEAAPELWTISNGEEFSVNTLPFNQQPVDLPLNFKAGVDGNYTITFENIDSFDANSSITLEDLFTGKTVDVRKNQTYSYTAAKEDANNRFVLHFYNVTSTPEIGEASNKALIYSYNNNIIVKAVDKQLNGKVEIINILGQTMETKSVSNSNFLTINTNLNKGVYIVRYSETDGYTQSQKVIIN